MMEELIRRLHEEGCSLVVAHEGQVRSFHGRGVSDLYDLLTEEPAFLQGASVADKVVGKGAAALMILGGVSRIHADIISRPALSLLASSGIEVNFGSQVPQIQNRARTGFCPVESLCLHVGTATECLLLIDGFMKQMRVKAQ